MLETGEVINVDGEPDQPGREAVHSQGSDFQNRPGAADGRHLSLIDEMEWLSLFAFRVANNRSGKVLSLLHGDRGGARERLSSLMGVSRLVSGDKHIWIASGAEIGTDNCPALGIALHPGRLRQW